MQDGKEYVKLWTSYSAYFEPLGDAEVGRLARAMIEYKSSGAEPKFSGNERFVWPAIKRDMDEAERAKAEFNQKQSGNGAKGGRPKKPTGFSENPKNPSLFSETQKSQGLRTKDYGQGTKDKNINPPPTPAREDFAGDPELGRVMTLYCNRVSAYPSATCLELLKGYTAEMGADVVCHAIDKALDDNKREWSYIWGILRSYQKQGVKSLDDVLREEQAHQKRTDAKRPGSKAPSGSGETAATADDLAEMRATLAKVRGAGP